MSNNPPTITEQTPPVSWANEVTHVTAVEEDAEAPPLGSSAPPAIEGTAPALNPPVWSGRKTAIAAALAIGLSTAGALGAAAAVQPGSGSSDRGQLQPGGFGPGRGRPGGVGPGRFGGQLPGQQQQQQQPPNQSQLPGQQLPGQQLTGQSDRSTT